MEQWAIKNIISHWCNEVTLGWQVPGAVWYFWTQRPSLHGSDWTLWELWRPAPFRTHGLVNRAALAGNTGWRELREPDADRRHGPTFALASSLATSPQPPDHFSQAPTGMWVLFVKTVMFGLPDSRYRMKVSLGHRRPPYGTQSLMAGHQRERFMCPWKLVFIYRSYCHFELAVKSRIKVFSLTGHRLCIVFLLLWKDLKNEGTCALSRLYIVVLGQWLGLLTSQCHSFNLCKTNL